MFKRFAATICLLVSIGLFSTIEISQKLIVQQCGTHIDPYMMVFVRFFVTGVLLLAVGMPVFWRSGKHLAWKDLGIFTLNGLLGITLCLSLFHYAIDQFHNASSAAVVFSANAVYTIIFARFINKEAWTFQKWIAIILGFAGATMFAFENGVPSPDTYKAIGLMSVSALLFALSVCFTKRTIARFGALVYMGGSSIIGALLSLPFFFLLSDKTMLDALRPMGDALMGMFYFVVVATAFAYFMYYRGLALSSAFHASMMFMLKPVLACVFAYCAIKAGIISTETKMNGITIAATCMIVLAMIMTQICKTNAPKGVASNKGKKQ